jgi:Protein of unknown function (DUF1579)
MNLTRVVGPAALVIGLTVPVAAAAQAGPPPMPKPGPEHALFKMDAGTWDATVEVSMMPGAKPETSKGVEVNTIGCGGLCLISDFKGEMAGMTFLGHGTTTWDVVKKKYSFSWTDSMSQGLSIGEATWDPKAKRLTGTMEGPDMTGKVVKSRSVVEYSSEGQRVMTAFAAGPDGKEMQVLKITYTQKK